MILKKKKKNKCENGIGFDVMLKSRLSWIHICFRKILSKDGFNFKTSKVESIIKIQRIIKRR